VVVRPIQEFFRLEAASGVLLLVATAVALIWANSPAAASYHWLFRTPFGLGSGAHAIRFSLETLVNDGMMTIFFVVVGMEVKSELVVGELSSPRRALLPGAAALGGMIAPVAIFVALNAGGPGERGWGIPMATDIAFAIGCLTLVGDRVPRAMVVLLTALAIFDDVGGILVIALFYGHGLHPLALGLAGLVTVILVLMNRAVVQSGPAYALACAALWSAFHFGGVHATLAGVVLGALVPARARKRPPGARGEELEAPLPRFVHALHPYVAFGIMPLFALANSGISLGSMPAGALTSALTVGTVLGLAVGKPLGILAFGTLAVLAGLAERPESVRPGAIIGVATLGGIGFTVALFIATLAFAGAPELLDQAKLGILIGSLAAGLGGVTILYATGPRRRPPSGQ
jgi:Na+:H+ antiporter, NhaA family